MECEIYEMPAGVTARATFRLVSSYPYDFDVVSATSRSNVYARTSDLNSATNNWLRTYYFCSKSSTNPKCP